MAEFAFTMHADEHTRFGQGLFRPGTKAPLRLPDGSTSEIVVRSSTVSPDGRSVELVVEGVLPDVMLRSDVRVQGSIGNTHA